MGLSQDVKFRVTPWTGGRMGNHVLHVYKSFWFACIHGIPLSSVVIDVNCGFADTKLFSSIRKNFIAHDDFAGISFNKTVDCEWYTAGENRNMLIDAKPEPGDNIYLLHGSVYPELPWELALFASIYDNKEFRRSVTERFCRVLRGDTVGYTIRRGDIVYSHLYDILTHRKIIDDIKKIVDQYDGLVTVLVSSDDISYVKGLMDANPDVAKYVYIVDEDVDTSLVLLSLCNQIYSNGDSQCTAFWVDRGVSRWMSSFGQIAQILNKSYNYADLVLPPHCDVSRVDECIDAQGNLTPMILESREPSRLVYPNYV